MPARALGTAAVSSSLRHRGSFPGDRGGWLRPGSAPALAASFPGRAKQGRGYAVLAPGTLGGVHRAPPQPAWGRGMVGKPWGNLPPLPPHPLRFLSLAQGGQAVVLGKGSQEPGGSCCRQLRLVTVGGKTPVEGPGVGDKAGSVPGQTRAASAPGQVAGATPAGLSHAPNPQRPPGQNPWLQERGNQLWGRCWHCGRRGQGVPRWVGGLT